MHIASRFDLNPSKKYQAFGSLTGNTSSATVPSPHQDTHRRWQSVLEGAPRAHLNPIFRSIGEFHAG